MGVDVGDVLREAYERLRTPAGLRLIAVGFVIQLVANVVTDSTTAGAAGNPPDSAPVGGVPTEGPLALDLPPSLLGVLGLLSLVASLMFTLVAIRTFAADARTAIPEVAYGENLLWPTLNLLVGGIVLGFVVAIGLVFLIVPGLFLLVSLLFFQVYVATEDDGFFDALGNSWSLASGNRFSLFVTGVGVVLVSLAVSIAFAILGFVVGVGSEFLGGVVETVGTAIVTTYTLAAVVAAYDQLVGQRARRNAERAGAPTDPDGQW